MLKYKDLDPRKKAFVFELDGVLYVYYAAEINPKPEPDVLTYIFTKHDLLRKDVIVIGISGIDEEFAQSCGVDYLNISEFL